MTAHLVLPIQVAISHELPEGRGLVATRPVRKNEKLLNVPGQLLLTADVALRYSTYGRLLESSGVPAWSVLAMFLAETRAQPARSKNEWGQYVDTLPSHTRCVLEWTPKEASVSPSPRTTMSCMHACMQYKVTLKPEKRMLVCSWDCYGALQP